MSPFAILLLGGRKHMADGIEDVIGDATPGDGGAGQSDVESVEGNAEFQAAFASVFGKSDKPSATGGEAEATPAEDETPTEEVEPVVEPVKPVVNKAVAGKPQGQEAALAASTLSPVLRQAAMRNEWKPSDIDAFYAAN